MNAVKKPAEPDHEPAAPSASDSASAPGPASPASAREGDHSPVHALQSRIEAAFSRKNEQKAMRIATMVLVVALSTWVAGLVLQSAG